MKVVVVESPSKAKTINKYLGPGFEVLASFGHIRDLPAKDGSVDHADNFKMLWEGDPQSQKRVNDIAHALKKADTLILATDPDREGEAISWHVLEALNEKKALKDQKIERVVFNAITKQSVTEAMKHPRAIDEALVDAYLARRALDYLVGSTAAALEAKPARRNPPPPFTPSPMQQEASRKLGFAPAIAMRLAQRLYEGVELDGEPTGPLTYMGTDGIDLAPEAITDIRAMIGKN